MRVTAREMARLHGLPDWFCFNATKWHGTRQIGNAVPPLLARAVATSGIEALGVRRTRRTEALELGGECLGIAGQFCIFDLFLENDDIARANAIINVPVNPEFASLNLAQCVLLMGYEWMRASAEVTDQTVEMAGTDWAKGQEIEHLAGHFEDRLDEAGFFFPEHKAQSMKINQRNMWSRMPLTRADVQMLHGILRQMVRWKERDE